MVAPLVAAGLITGGSALAAGALESFGQAETNKTNREIAREQMAFQERMSSTAYQRSMADMKKAGLNPMLAYEQGGSSTPPGAGAVMQNALAGASKGLSTSALQAYSLKKDLELADAQVKTQSSLRELQDTQKNREIATARQINAQADIAEANKIPAQLSAEMYKENPWLIKAEKIAEYLLPAMRTGATVYGINKATKGLGNGPSNEDRKKWDNPDNWERPSKK